MSEYHVIAKKLAERFIERADHLLYRGKKRDDAAMDFFVGAAVLAEAQGNKPLREYLDRVVFFRVGVHGYRAVRELAKNKAAEKETA